MRISNVQCGSTNDRRFIRYNTRYNIPDPLEVLQSARDEYGTTKRLPCEDIHITCSNNTDFPNECTYEYELNNISLINILRNEDRPNCYWLEIGQLYQASCKGTCGDLQLIMNTMLHFRWIFYFVLTTIKQRKI